MLPRDIERDRGMKWVKQTFILLKLGTELKKILEVCVHQGFEFMYLFLWKS